MSVLKLVDNVRFLVGDNDNDDIQITNDNIVFALDETGDDVYAAAAVCARAIAAKYSRQVDTRFESVASDYSQRAENYYKLARRLEQQSKKYGKKGLGMPDAGGLTYTDIDLADENPDRVKPKFRQDQFAYPSRHDMGDEYGY